jgi:predicted outer membrane repeat protein
MQHGFREAAPVLPTTPGLTVSQSIACLLLQLPADAVVLQHSSFVANSADQGGAMAIYDWTTVQMQNCSFAGNAAFNPDIPDDTTFPPYPGTLGPGGGVDAHDTARIDITDCSFSNNIARSGGAIYIRSATLLNVTALQLVGADAKDPSGECHNWRKRVLK